MTQFKQSPETTKDVKPTAKSPRVFVEDDQKRYFRCRLCLVIVPVLRAVMDDQVCTCMVCGNQVPLATVDLIDEPALAVREQPAQDPAYLLAVIEHSAQLEARGELNDRQRQYWSECRAALLRQMGGEVAK